MHTSRFKKKSTIFNKNRTFSVQEIYFGSLSSNLDDKNDNSMSDFLLLKTSLDLLGSCPLCSHRSI